MAEYTSLDSLNDIIRLRPTHGSPYRTRAVTRIFKEDFVGAARDLSEGLAVHRLYHNQHPNEQRDLILTHDATRLAREERTDGIVDDKYQPGSLEPQLLFHRGGTYLTLACNHIATALQCQSTSYEHSAVEQPLTTSSVPREVQRASLEARRLVRTYAKRALRDYTAFLAHLDYTPGIPPKYSETFLRKARLLNQSSANLGHDQKVTEFDGFVDYSSTSSALVRYETQKERHRVLSSLPSIPKRTVYSLDAMFAAVRPAKFLSYPTDTAACGHEPCTTTSDPFTSVADFAESCTYHPLLTDVLHSLLLAHSLVQTPPKELLRHAYMTARLTRITDGYPIFVAARSPARADWVEVLHRTNNWIGLRGRWEDLCTPSSGPSSTASQDLTTTREDTAKAQRDRVRRQDIYNALADDRACDGKSFRAGVKVKHLRSAHEEEDEQRKEYLRAPAGMPPTNGITKSDI